MSGWKNMKRIVSPRSLTCFAVAVVAGVIVADIFPARGQWNWTGMGTGVLVYIILLFAFTRRRK